MQPRPRRRFFAFAAPLIALAAIALVVAGCGSSNDDASSGSAGSTASSSAGGAYGDGAATQSKAPAASSSAGAAAVTVKTARTPLGTIVVDGSGRTLYLWEADTGMRSTCSGPCAQGWPPLTTKGRAAASDGAQGGMLGTSMRDDGTTQVTYAGHPLYTFVEDKKPGEDNGTDSKAFGASWYPLHPNGQKAGH
jgi:predicted lipoprotein with Yx(FWY)xxD motif